MSQLELLEGTNRDLSKSQWFTPPELAQRVVEWASVARGQHEVRGSGLLMVNSPRPMRVLEPSAGNGALVRPLVAAGAEVCAVELDARYQLDLEAYLKGRHRPLIWNFLECTTGGLGKFDLCVMNPPYEDGQDVAFILHALKFAPRVVGIFTDRILFGVERKRELWSKVRPTRLAYCSQRPFKGAQTDYVVAELHAVSDAHRDHWPSDCRMEWW